MNPLTTCSRLLPWATKLCDSSPEIDIRRYIEGIQKLLNHQFGNTTAEAAAAAIHSRDRVSVDSCNNLQCFDPRICYSLIPLEMLSFDCLNQNVGDRDIRHIEIHLSPITSEIWIIVSPQMN